MQSLSRQYSFIDRCIENFDNALRTLTAANTPAQRANPALNIAEHALTEIETKHSAGLLRVDHAGEICAQALYQGQALTARSETVRTAMQQSAVEENDHLVWCQQRLTELHQHTSYLNPIWYTGSLFLGIIAGLAGDRWSLGFVAATERQVTQHLTEHLQRLPQNDEKSRAILTQMQQDEMQHASVAVANGAAELPAVVQQIMRMMAKIMTTTTYWV